MISARPVTAASGKPPAIPFAVMIMSGTTFSCSTANIFPVRAKPVCTSSAIKIIPSPDNKVHVVEGKQWDPNELQATLKKVNEMEAKNKGRVLSMAPKIFASKVATRAKESVKKKEKPKKEPKKKETEEIFSKPTQI